MTIGASRKLTNFLDRAMYMTYESAIGHDYAYSAQFYNNLDMVWNNTETYKIVFGPSFQGTSYISEILVTSRYMTETELNERMVR